MSTATSIASRVPAANDDDRSAGHRFLFRFAREYAPRRLRQKRNGEAHAGQISAGYGEVARLTRAAAEQHRVKAVQLGNRQIAADIHTADKVDPFLPEEFDPPAHEFFWQLHVWNAEHEQSARFLRFFKHGHGKPVPVELVCGGQSGRAGADDCDGLSVSLLRRMRRNPAFFPSQIA